MPDPTKVKAMREAGIKPMPCCVHFRHVGQRWGYCTKHGTYQHEKHDGERPLPTHTTFGCDDFEAAELVELGPYPELLS